jgi:hypothetical protein
MVLLVTRVVVPYISTTSPLPVIFTVLMFPYVLSEILSQMKFPVPVICQLTVSDLPESIVIE